MIVAIIRCLGQVTALRLVRLDPLVDLIFNYMRRGLTPSLFRKQTMCVTSRSCHKTFRSCLPSPAFLTMVMQGCGRRIGWLQSMLHKIRRKTLSKAMEHCKDFCGYYRGLHNNHIGPGSAAKTEVSQDGNDLG